MDKENHFIVLRKDVYSKWEGEDLQRWNKIKEIIQEKGLDVVIGRNKIPQEGGMVAVVVAIIIYKNKSILLQTYALSEFLTLKTFEDFFENHEIIQYKS